MSKINENTQVTVYSPVPINAEAIENSIKRIMLEQSSYYTNRSKMREDHGDSSQYSYRVDIHVTNSPLLDIPSAITREYMENIRRDTAKNNYEDAGKLAQELSDYLYRTADKARKLELTQSLREAVDTAYGKTAIMIWGQDCDLAESTHMTRIEPTAEAYDDLEQHIANDAEGPYNLIILTPEEAAKFTPKFRDHAAEMMGY